MEKIISFVVLHYESLKDTIMCIDSMILYICQNSAVHVIIVDNGSKKERVIDIEEKYRFNQQIHFLYLDKNYGFAKGNNKGFEYAKKELKSDIIILCNNDLVFKQHDFVDILLKQDDGAFDVAGPSIYSMIDGKNQNPDLVQFRTNTDVNKRIVKNLILYLASFFGLDTCLISMFSRYKSNIKLAKYNDFQLHGACLIFNKKYIDLFNGLCDKTFMYGEESLLLLRCKEYNLKMVFLRDIEVYHKEGSSTTSLLGKGSKKRRFFYKWSINSCKIFKGELNKIKCGI